MMNDEIRKHIIKPDSFVVGAPRCGTTSLYMFFHQHPDVFVPEAKELHFFSYPEVLDTYYKVKFVQTMQEYLRHFTGAEQFSHAVDVSPSYLFHRAAAERIYRFNPNAKIIIILRNPVNRAISHYLMDVQIGYQCQPLSNFLVRTEENRLFYKEYIELGLYSEQLRNYFEIFGKDQVLVLLTEHLRADPDSVCEKIMGFLGMPDTDVRIGKYNVFLGMPKSRFIHAIRTRSFLNRIAVSLPVSVKFFLKKHLLNRNVEKPSFEKEKKLLYEIFSHEIDLLSEILGFDFSIWLRRSNENG